MDHLLLKYEEHIDGRRGGGRGVKFPGIKHFEGVLFNVISVTRRGWV